ncbi:MAG: Spy/CpxP family protein refolding chaperone [Armatimonadetes bacterium]|nr:Spy/CpxP family protein refolding chaperone [Armatimonadota bacterium]
MKNTLKSLLTIGFAVVACLAVAQGGGGGGRGGRQFMMGGGGVMGVSMLVGRADVRKDIKVTEDQASKLDAFQEEQRAKMREQFQNAGGGGGRPDPEAMRAVFEKMNKESEEAVAKILSAEQIARVKQIGIQLAGSRAVMSADVQKALGMTAEQTEKIKKLQADQATANQELMRKMRDQEIDRDQFQELRTKNDKALGDEIDKVLTTEQKSKLKEMGGAKFTADTGRGI